MKILKFLDKIVFFNQKSKLIYQLSNYIWKCSRIFYVIESDSMNCQTQDNMNNSGRVIETINIFFLLDISNSDETLLRG